MNEVLSTDIPEDVLRRALEAALAALMEAEVTELTGAACGERTEDRRVQRNGYRERRFDTPVGTVPLRIPKLRQGTYLPRFLGAHQRSDKALVAAIQETYVHGVSTRKVRAIAQALGVESMSKSTVSARVKALDPQVKAFRERPLPSAPTPIPSTAGGVDYAVVALRSRVCPSCLGGNREAKARNAGRGGRESAGVIGF